MLIPELRGITTIYATHRVQHLKYATHRVQHLKYATHRVQHLKHSWHWTYNSFILTVAIIGVVIYSIEAGGYNVIDSHARDMYRNSHSEGTCLLLEIPSIHKLVEYFQTLHRNEDIYELKGVHIATFEPHLFSSNVEHCSISNVDSYQCSCCDDIALSNQILVFTCARSGSLCHSLLSWPLVSSLCSD